MVIFLFPIVSASLIVAVGFGGRQILPLTIDGITQTTPLDYLTLSLAFAIGQVVWGFANSVGGVIGDKFGNEKALILGIFLSAVGIALIPHCSSTFEIIFCIGLLSAGGSGIAGLAVAMSAVNKRVPSEKSGLAFGMLNAGGSVGQTFLAPLGVLVILNFGWANALYCLSLLLICTLPFAYLLKDPNPSEKITQTNEGLGLGKTMWLAFCTPSYNYLALGFFTCGFHVAFIGTHMPGIIAACGLPPTLSGWSLALIGIFNILGSLFAGWYISTRSMKIFLSAVYFSRAIIVIIFLLSPKDTLSILLFSAAVGATYLSTVPPTAALVNRMFGPKYMATLFGIALFSHQVGGFLGAYFGGYFFNITGEYTLVWFIDIGLALFAAAIHLPIKEKLVTQASI